MVVNKSGHNIVLAHLEYDEPIKTNATRIYLLGPDDTAQLPVISLTYNLGEPFSLTVNYFSKINPDAFNKFKESAQFYFPKEVGVIDYKKSAYFATRDKAYIEMLKQAKTYLPIITIMHDPKKDTPVINAPATVKELQEYISADKRKPVTRAVCEATGLPTPEGAISGLISQYAE